MLRVRAISAIVGLAILFLVIWSGQIVLGLAIVLLSILALSEFYKAAENLGYRPAKAIGYMVSVSIIYMGFNNHFDQYKLINPMTTDSLFLGVFLILIFLFSYIVFFNKKFNIVDISLTFLGIIYIPFMFSFILMIRNMNEGFFYVWLVFIGAFATDTFAYFTGRWFGKTKLMPVISPKKTLEGSIGGTIGCILITILYGVYLQKSNFINGIPLYHFAIIGFICSFISQLGDWGASSIKRHAKIKDYGNLMPGHGGVLDRFDSILFTAPVVYFYIKFIIS